jgi:hypothetical protein
MLHVLLVWALAPTKSAETVTSDAGVTVAFGGLMFTRIQAFYVRAVLYVEYYMRII